VSGLNENDFPPLEPQPFITEEGRQIERLRAGLAAAIKQRDEATAWRLIETAPMNGTVVMLYGHGRVTVGSWVAVVEYSMSPESLSGIGDDHPKDESAFWESHDGGFTEEHPPTHWMPLPQLPREKEGGGA
jgi:hypothetical protein